MAAAEVIIAGYRLLRRLGVGGMAEAFEAEPLDEGRNPKRVCIKRLLPAQAEDPELRAAFHREAHLLETLDHSKIVRVLDHFGEEGSECMVLELVNGVDLRALLAHQAGRLPSGEVEVLAVDLLRALDHAHTPRAGFEGIVHRDVSSSNVLISVDGEARLTDFGIAKELEGQHAAASTGIKGKIPYMAPEQIRGERTSAQSDLFSLGVVLYEALAGRRPFDGAHDVETMTKILGNERAPIASLARAPRELLGLVEALLAFEPRERPASASDALRSFENLVEEPMARLRLGARAAAVKPTLRTYTPLPFVPNEAASLALATPRGRSHSLPETRAHAIEPARPAPRRSPWGRWLVAAATVTTLLAALAIALQPDRRRSDAAREVEVPRIEPALLAQEESGDERSVCDDASSPPAPAPGVPVAAEEDRPQPDDVEPTSDRPGTLRVVVIPWGSVWIDGVPQGRAPRVLRLEPGAHWIGAGIGAIEKRKRVVVRPGARRTVELDLSGG
jgi:eukaryotic-like serine/threonine-protein kinase